MTSARIPIATWIAGIAFVGLGVMLVGCSAGAPGGMLLSLAAVGTLSIWSGVALAFAGSRKLENSVNLLITYGYNADSLGAPAWLVAALPWFARAMMAMLVVLAGLLIPTDSLAPAYPLWPIFVGLLMITAMVRRLGKSLARHRRDLIAAEAADASADSWPQQQQFAFREPSS